MLPLSVKKYIEALEDVQDAAAGLLYNTTNRSKAHENKNELARALGEAALASTDYKKERLEWEPDPLDVAWLVEKEVADAAG